MTSIDTFNNLWKTKQITRPVIVLIGGYAGTGKSTIAQGVAAKLQYTQIMPTGILRAIAQTQTTNDNNPALFKSTYDLHVLGGSVAAIRSHYEQQCAPVGTIIDATIRFLGVEKQHFIIEGNHVVPWHTYDNTDCHMIELYLYVRDTVQHKQMLCGPTHSRSVSEKQFETGRTLHDTIVQGAIERHKALFECSDIHGIQTYIEQRFSEIIQHETQAIRN